MEHMRLTHRGELLSQKCTDDMTEAEWLACREHGPAGDRDFTIGGSDIAAALGVSPYKSKIEFWEEKMGIETKVEKEIPKETFKKGHRFEAPIAMGLQDDLEEVYGEGNVIVDFDKYIYGCAEKDAAGNHRYPYMVINYDCNVKIFKDGEWKFYLGEIKTLDEHAYDIQKNWKNGIVPIQYDYQCRYYMKALDVDGIFICCAWGLSKANRAHVFIERDISIEEDMLDSADDFYWSLKAGIAPEACEDENKMKLLSYYGRKYAQADKKERIQFEIPPSYKDTVEELARVDQMLLTNETQRQRLEQKRDEILCDMFPLFEKNTDGFIEMDEKHRIYIERRDHFKRDGFDEEAFKSSEPALYVEFTKEVLDITKLKKKHPSIAGKYVVKGTSSGKTDFKVATYDKENHLTVSAVKTSSGRWEEKKKKGDRIA